MPRVHCASCGAPSVLGASRCPRCLAPFGAAGPMSGMVLAAEESTPRPTPRWWIAGAAVLAVLVAVGSVGIWAARRARGGETPRVTEEPSVTVAPMVTPTAAPTVTPTALPARDTVVPSAPSQPTKPTATPIPAPVPAPSPTPASRPAVGDTAYRATTWVWLRANPVNTAEQLAVVNPKQVVRVLERRFGWVRVRTDGREGWMSADYLERLP